MNQQMKLLMIKKSLKRDSLRIYSNVCGLRIYSNVLTYIGVFDKIIRWVKPHEFIVDFGQHCCCSTVGSASHW